MLKYKREILEDLNSKEELRYQVRYWQQVAFAFLLGLVIENIILLIVL